MNKKITRRALISAALTLFAGDGLAKRRNHDRGIGGTGAPGVRFDPDDEDRGIGGTGVVGTIRKFGSIVVNDMRIGYSLLTRVQIDGRHATPADLRIGQVVQTVATSDGADLMTDRIVVTSEVVGPIDGMAQGRLKVLGQNVATGLVDVRGLRKGHWVAVSGLRDLDGVIHASHIQHRDNSLAQIAGPVRIKNGVARIGGLPLVNLNLGLEGRRVLAQVGRLDGKPAVISVTPDPERATMPNVRHLSIETFAVHRGGQVRMGSGLTAAAPDQWTSTAPARAVVAVTVNPDGGMTATSQRSATEPDATAPTDSGPQQKGPSSSTHGNHESRSDRTRKEDAAAKRGNSAAPEASKSATTDVWNARSAPAPNHTGDSWGKNNNGQGGPASAPPVPQTHFEQPHGWSNNGGHHRR